LEWERRFTKHSPFRLDEEKLAQQCRLNAMDVPPAWAKGGWGLLRQNTLWDTTGREENLWNGVLEDAEAPCPKKLKLVT
jgi:hypothetical protein